VRSGAIAGSVAQILKKETNVVNLDVSRPMKNQRFHFSQRKAAAVLIPT